MSSFRNSTVYQIYIKSFCDSNGDGIGDLNGIRQKIPYLKSLGIEYLWITPFFLSPMNDNGYDVADYFSVNPMFGTMEDAEALLKEANESGIGVMFDMVFNHTSTEHEWFQKALAGDPHYKEYYIWKDPVDGGEPTNWISKFGGSAWEYVPSMGQYYLHLFDKTQADLNWENPAVREELKQVIRFWKEKGVSGFRFDVVNLISKPEQFADDFEGDGRRFYTDGPHVHEFLKELVADTGIADMMTVGEMSSTSLDNCIRYTNPAEQELKMVFSFHHLKIDYKDGQKWELQEPDYGELRRLFTLWQEGMQDAEGWNAVFWCNHDQPRIVSRLGNDQQYQKVSAKMLAAMIHLMRGTPYIYQGEEIGMTNPGFTSIEQYRDVESINYYQILMNEGKSSEEALRIIGERSRDDSRTPMQWDGSDTAGFTAGRPWIGIPDNHTYINVESEEQDPDSVLSYYRELIRLRKEYEIIADGNIHITDAGNDRILSYERSYERNGASQKLYVFCNLSSSEEALESAFACGNMVRLTGNYAALPVTEDEARQTVLAKLRPYEVVALLQE